MALPSGRTRRPHRLAVPLPRSRARVRHLLVSFGHSRTICCRGEAIQTSDSKIRFSMNTPERFAELVQTFFCDYLIKQRDLSPRTVSAYRDTFRLLLSFLQRACGKRPDQLMLSNLTAAQLIAFLAPLGILGIQDLDDLLLIKELGADHLALEQLNNLRMGRCRDGVQTFGPLNLLNHCVGNH